jgi:hypothetical protein
MAMSPAKTSIALAAEAGRALLEREAFAMEVSHIRPDITGQNGISYLIYRVSGLGQP